MTARGGLALAFTPAAASFLLLVTPTAPPLPPPRTDGLHLVDTVRHGESIEGGEQAVQQLHHRLGVRLPRHLRVADDVGEEDGYCGWLVVLC